MRLTRLLAAVLGISLAALAPPAYAAAPTAKALTNDWGPLRILGHEVAPGQREKLAFDVMPSFVDSLVNTQVIALRGQTPGLTLCITAGIHGDELNGVEIARRILASVDPHTLAGTLIVVPIVNASGFRSGQRTLADGRDLNRAFPGDPEGSTASRVANLLFEQIIRQCHGLIDLHSVPLRRNALPQTRTDLSDATSSSMARSFGGGVVLGDRGPGGSLRRAALDAGIPTILYEAGAPLRFDEDEIARGVAGVRRVMARLDLLPSEAKPPQSTVYRQAQWVRVPTGLGGILSSPHKPGDSVAKGEVLGLVVDPINDGRVEVIAPLSGRIVEMAAPQVVLPGSAVFRLASDEAPPEAD
jgi:predicted deacylase